MAGLSLALQRMSSGHHTGFVNCWSRILPQVYITEGERACDALRAKGSVVVTSSGGSSKPQSTDRTPLSNREFASCPTRMEPAKNMRRRWRRS
jgi:hypothetical protein